MLCAVTLALAVTLSAAPARPMLLSVEALQKAGDKALIVDARDSQAYEEGHLPGAISLPWVDLALMPRNPSTRPPREMAAIFTSRGIPSRGWVVVYGAGPDGLGEEGRLFWSLTYLGQRDVSLLDGGIAAWKRAGKKVSTEVAMRPAQKFVESADPSVRIEKQALVAAIAAKQVIVVDVREPDEFAGAKKYGEPRGGHIPGAINLPWKSVLDETGALLPKPRLTRLLSERGVSIERPLVVYCTGGVRSGFAFFALKLAGAKSVANYDGSFWDWASDPALPVETR